MSNTPEVIAERIGPLVETLHDAFEVARYRIENDYLGLCRNNQDWLRTHNLRGLTYQQLADIQLPEHWTLTGNHQRNGQIFLAYGSGEMTLRFMHTFPAGETPIAGHNQARRAWYTQRALSEIADPLHMPPQRLLLVWQEQARNQWSTAIQQALADERVASASAPTAFSLGDRKANRRLLESTGFVDVAFAEVHEPVFYGPTVEAAYEAVVTLFLPRNGTDTTVQPSDEAQRRLRTLLQAQLRDDGVFFDSRAWIVTARRR
jgi:hypothetical protein